MLRRDAGVDAASGCPLLHPTPHTPAKPVQEAPGKTPEIIQSKGVEYIHLTRVHLLHAHPACRTRLCTRVPRGQLGWVCTGRAAQAGRAPRLQLCHACVCLPTPEPLSSPAASEEGMKPGVWALVKSCTIFYRRCVCAQCEPTNTYV